MANYSLIDNRFLFRVPVFPNNTPSYDIIFNDPVFKEAIFLASPDLYDNVAKQNVSSISGLNSKLQNSILKYIVRSTHRATPFGWFAGCGVGEVKDNAKNLVVVDSNKLSNTHYKCRVKLDTDFLSSLINNLKVAKELKVKSLYFPNNSGYFIMENYRYIETKYIEGKKKFFLSEIESSASLDCILQRCSAGGISYQEMIDILLRNDIEKQEASEYVDFLIENQVMINEADPPLLSRDLLRHLIDLTSSCGLKIEEIQLIQDALHSINNTSSKSNRIQLYKYIEDCLKKTSITFQRKYLFQCDLSINPREASLSKSLVEQIKSVIPLLSRLTSLKGSPLLDKFKVDFLNRYESEEVPMNEVFDPDIGIGFGNHTSINTSINKLVDDIGFVVYEGDANISSQMSSFSEAESFLLKKYYESLKRGSHEVEILEEELRNLPETGNMPDTISTLASIIESDVDNPLLLIEGATGLSAANFIARFFDTNEEIYDLIKKIVHFEDMCVDQNEIIAEIIHLPENRMGNILHRPFLRKYELPYIAKQSTSITDTIFLNDILISIRENKIRLRSKKHNRYILPILTSAHNYAKNTLPIYHFLSLLQVDSIKKFSFFGWPKSIQKEPFLPRVRYQNIVLSPAKWNIDFADWEKLPEISSPSFKAKFAKFKEQRKLPNQFLVAEFDNMLFIDCNDYLSVELFVSQYKNKIVSIHEYLYNANDSFIRNELGDTYNNEIILFWGKEKSTQH